MDGENNGKPNTIKMDDLGGTPLFFGNTHIKTINNHIMLGRSDLYFFFGRHVYLQVLCV